MDKQITIKEFIKLPDDQKREMYRHMSDHDKFLWRTQHEPLIPVVIGHVERTPKEQEIADKEFKEYLKSVGVIKN